MNKVIRGLTLATALAAAGGVGFAAVAQTQAPGSGPTGSGGGAMGSAQTGQNQTGQNQTGQNQTGQNQTGPETGPGMMRHGMMGSDPGGPGMMGPGMMAKHDGAGRHGLRDPAARLENLKTDLAIRPDQTVAWDAYAKVVRDTVARRREERGTLDRAAIQAMPETERNAVIQRLRDQRARAFETIKAAAEALLPALDDTQQAKARAELPGLARHGHGRMKRHAWMGTMPGPTGTQTP